MCCFVLLWDSLWHLCISCTPSLLFRFVRRQQVAGGRWCEFDGEAVSVVFSLTVSGRASGCPLCSLSHSDLWIKRQLLCLLCYLGLERSCLSLFLHFFHKNLLFAFAVILSSMCQQCLSLRNRLSQANLCPGGVQLSSSIKASRHYPPHVRPSWQCLQLHEYWNHNVLALKMCLPAFCGDSVFLSQWFDHRCCLQDVFHCTLYEPHKYAALLRELHLKLVYSSVLTVVQI